ncbi:MAG: hypothetical protein ACE5R6_05965 [Candidatus Heimdallarchaeota archaeon]
MVPHRKKIVLWILIANFLLLFGGSINPLVLEEQLHRRINPSILLEPNNPKISDFNKMFEKVLRVDKERTGMPDNIKDPRIYEIKLIEAFILSQIEWVSDFVQYLTVDRLVTPDEVLTSMKEDCDGRAILAGSLLLHRGYDVWIFVSWYHWWVVILLRDELPIQILTKAYNGPWYMKFNDKGRVFRGPPLIGFVLYNFVLAAIVPFLLPLLYGTLPQDIIFKLLLLLLGLIPFSCLVVFHILSS